MTYNDIIQKIMDRKDPDWEQVHKINCQAFQMLSQFDPRNHAELLLQLEAIAYAIDRPKAEEIVHMMKPKGQMWTFDQVKSFVETKGVQGNWINWYLVMNMCYNDYYNTARQYGLQSDDNFYFNLAKDFIEDPDAKHHKVAKYFA